MGIEKILRTREMGVFSNFRWPSDLPNFARYNLIYGWNGSGKTTISRAMASLEAGRPHDQGEVTLLVDGESLRGSDFSDSSRSVRVFNRDFVDQQVFQSGGSGMPLVIVLGQQNIETQKRLEERSEDLAAAVEAEQRCDRLAKNADKALEDFMTDRAEVIRVGLGAPDSDYYRNYRRNRYRERVSELRRESRRPTLLSEEDFNEAELRRDAKAMDALSLTSTKPPSVDSLVDGFADLLQQTPTSMLIASIADDPEIQDWVGRGVELHEGREMGQCLFCLGSLSSERWTALKMHFDDSFRTLQEEIEGKSRVIEDAKAQLGRIRLPGKTEVQANLQHRWEDAIAVFEIGRAKADTTLDRLVEALAEKVADVTQTAFSGTDLGSPEWPSFSELEELAQLHNEQVDNATAIRADARRELELHHLAEDWPRLEALETQGRDAAKALKEAREKRERIQQEVSDLQSQLAEPERAAVDMTADLHAFLGRDDLSLEVDGVGYSIMRGGRHADRLSEGERTAIAVLYFLKTLEHEEFQLEEGIVVLDDPVSSLDAQALYLAFGVIRERTKHAHQLFVLTHNWQFLCLVKQWFLIANNDAPENDAEKPAGLYMIETAYADGKRESQLKEMDPLLAEYESEYHYLFALVYDVARDTESRELANYYIMPNVARRVLETFLAFQYPGTGTRLARALGSVQVESWHQAKLERIRRFLSLESHGDAIGNTQMDPSLLAEAPAVMRDVLDLVKRENRDHHRRMVRAVSRAGQ